MEFRFDPQARRLRMRAFVPAGHHAESFVATDQFKFGIEEEYFLSDAQTFEVPAETPDELFAIIPPIVARELVATSGPKQKPRGLRNMLS